MIFPACRTGQSAWTRPRRVPGRSASLRTGKIRCERRDHDWEIPPCRQLELRSAKDGSSYSSAPVAEFWRDPVSAPAEACPPASATRLLANCSSRDGRYELSPHAPGPAVARAPAELPTESGLDKRNAIWD